MPIIYSESLSQKNVISNFQACKLKEALIVKCITKRSLANNISATPTAISSWESGKKYPTRKDLRELSRATDLPENFFIRPELDWGSSPMFFRSMASATKSKQKRSKIRLRWAQEISLSLQNWVDLPPVNIPEFTATDYHEISDQDIEWAASECRNLWELGEGPISDVMLVMENAGIIVIRDYVNTVKMDGLSNWSKADNRPYILVAREKEVCVRSRMDIAHELGHLILHKNIDSSVLKKKENFDEIERQAFLFASAFLMPAEEFISEVYSLSPEALCTLKGRWKVSIAAMMMRFKNLGIIGEDRAEMFWRHYSFRGWRKGEPLDNVLPPEKPRLLRRSIKLLVDSGVRSKENLLEDFALSGCDVETLCGLSPGYMTSEIAEVANIGSRERRESKSDYGVHPSNNATILQFQRKLNDSNGNQKNLKDRSYEPFPTHKSSGKNFDESQN